MRRRYLWFGISILVILGIFFVPLRLLIQSSLHSGYSSHIVLIPLLTAYVIWSERSKVFSVVAPSPRMASIAGGLGIVFGIIGRFGQVWLGSQAALFVMILSMLLFVVASFGMCFGTRALNRSRFAFFLLALMLPIPSFLIDRVIHFLQVQSADLSVALFSLLGVPILRNEFVLTIPGVSVEVAKECSGINSSIALFVITLLIAHETLKTNWRRTALVLLIIPLSIFKNALRIVTLTLLASRVDPGFLTGRLHHQGGFVFFLITLAVAYPIWLLLKRTETRAEAASSTQLSASSAGQ